VTRASDLRPTRRVLVGAQGVDYVVELRGNLILCRPKGTRRGGANEVVITPSLLHQRLLIARAEAERAERRRSRRTKSRRK
jgi:hypothetical protein